MQRRCVPAPVSGEAAVGRTEVHSCINIYNFRQQFRDRFVPWKCCLRTTIRRVEETTGFVIFPKCFVVFSKCCLRGPSNAFRVAVRYEKTPEQARDSRRSAPMLCKDNTFFAEIQIARFYVNISRTAMEVGASPPTPPLKGRGGKDRNREPACLLSSLLAQRRGGGFFSPCEARISPAVQIFSCVGDRFIYKKSSLPKGRLRMGSTKLKNCVLGIALSRLALPLQR